MFYKYIHLFGTHLALTVTVLLHLLQRQRVMSQKDKNLVTLYWTIQKKMHTQPELRTYFQAIQKQIKKHRIRFGRINDLVLELVSQGVI